MHSRDPASLQLGDGTRQSCATKRYEPVENVEQGVKYMRVLPVGRGREGRGGIHLSITIHFFPPLDLEKEPTRVKHTQLLRYAAWRAGGGEAKGWDSKRSRCGASEPLGERGSVQEALAARGAA